MLVNVLRDETNEHILTLISLEFALWALGWLRCVSGCVDREAGLRPPL